VLDIRNGELWAEDRPLAAIPEATWVRLEIHCALGESATGTYGLTLTAPGAEVIRVTDLACGGGPRFKSLNWLGFIGLADAAVAFYVDDLQLDAAVTAGE
jgi:hypothetical protein